MKSGAPGMPLTEYGHVGIDPSFDSASNAAGPSTPSVTSDDHLMIDVSHDTDTEAQTILNQTLPWPPETDELVAFSSESGKFLSGPGVIPVQGAMPTPQIVEHEQDTQTPRFEQVAFDNRQLVTVNQPPPEGQGG